MDVTNFELIKNMDIDEFTEWLDELDNVFEEAPWMKWWNDTYCAKCESEKAYFSYIGKEIECAWCELYAKCRFFPEYIGSPNTTEIIKLWLESEIKDEN